jgi:uncharacterized RDD family membrane protein YckC
MRSSPNPYAAPDAVVADIPVAGAGPVLAERGTRLKASIVDSLLTVLPLLVLGIVAAFVVPGMDLQWLQPYRRAGGYLGQVIPTLLVFITFVILNARLLAHEGQTLGKRWAGIRIVRSDGTRATLSWLILRRQLPQLVLNLIPVVNVIAVIDPLLIFRTSRKCLHDNIADTIVVKV